jgi:hypothetical protein
MPNGRPGDHPYTDIVHHGEGVYSDAVDDLVQKVAELSHCGLECGYPGH